MTSSAAVRLYRNARARDVTDLLRNTMKLPASTRHEDALVLVGTLFSVVEIQFEHEVVPPTTIANRNQSTKDTSGPSRSDPFHLVVSLKPDESPLQVRDQMKEHLERLQSLQTSGTRNIISPKLQWYFVPLVDVQDGATKIFNCIDLDGYSTSMEEEDPDSDDDDGIEKITDKSEPEQDPLLTRFPWLEQNPNISSQVERDNVKQTAMLESKRLNDLLASRTSQQVLSGYLWKRSRRDHQVWRKVHCVVTDDCLWYVGRLRKKAGYTYSHHRRIRLQRAFLLPPSTTDDTVLFRTPHSWEVVSGKGSSHVFRASNASTRQLWMNTLGDRILQSFENSLVESAELLTLDECQARNKRRQVASAVPLSSRKHKATGRVLSWGVKVADYRMACRYVMDQLPAKALDSSNNNITPPGNLEPSVKELLDGCWKVAEAVLDSIPGLISDDFMLGEVEAHCQHVQRYFLRESNRRDAPPIDLFDDLLKEVQLIVSSAPQTL